MLKYAGFSGSFPDVSTRCDCVASFSWCRTRRPSRRVEQFTSNTFVGLSTDDRTTTELNTLNLQTQHVGVKGQTFGIFLSPTWKPSSWAQAYTDAVLPTPVGPVRSTVFRSSSPPSSPEPSSPWKSPQSHASAEDDSLHSHPTSRSRAHSETSGSYHCCPPPLFSPASSSSRQSRLVVSISPTS